MAVSVVKGTHIYFFFIFFFRKTHSHFLLDVQDCHGSGRLNQPRPACCGAENGGPGFKPPAEPRLLPGSLAECVCYVSLLNTVGKTSFLYAIDMKGNNQVCPRVCRTAPHISSFPNVSCNPTNELVILIYKLPYFL